MLGYVRAYKPEMKLREYEIYKGVYCSLCHSLGRHYGPFAQLLLSYDFSFFALLRMAATEQPAAFTRLSCPYNPAKKCMGCKRNAWIDACADAVIITAFYRLRDGLQDSVLYKKAALFLLYPLFLLPHRKAAKRAPRCEELIRRAMRQQRTAEQNPGTGIDAACDPSAEALGYLFSLGACGEQQRQLRRLGYCIGRWVYLIDSVDDLEKDSKTGSFNPLKAQRVLYDGAQWSVYCTQLLHRSAAEAVHAFEQLKLLRFQPILENILYDGLEQAMQQVLNKQNNGGEQADEQPL